QRIVRDASRIGPHVRDQPDWTFFADVDALVESLGDLHRLANGEPQLSRGLLLKLRSYKGRNWVSFLLPGGDRLDQKGLLLNLVDEMVGLCSILYMNFGLLWLHVEVGDLHRLLFDAQEPGVERRRQRPGEVCLNRPVLVLDEVADLAFAFDDQSQRNR